MYVNMSCCYEYNNYAFSQLESSNKIVTLDLANNKILERLISCLYLQYDDDPGLRAVVLAGGINQTDNVEERGKQWPQIGIFHFLDVLEKSSD